MLSPLLGKWTEDMVASVPASCTTGTIKGKEKWHLKQNIKRHQSKHKIDRRLGVNLWGRSKSPVNARSYMRQVTWTAP